MQTRRGGFSLLEVMIASTILLLVFVGFVTGLVQANRIQYLADRNYCASVIARNRIEECKIYAFKSLSALVETQTCVNKEGEGTSTGQYWRTTSLETSTNNPDCVEVVVGVTYQVRPGKTSEVPVEVKTMIGG